MNDIMKIVQVLENSSILLKGITKTIENGTKERKEESSGILWELLGASFLGNMLIGKRVSRAGYGDEKRKGIVRAGYGNEEGKGILRAGYENKNF